MGVLDAFWALFLTQNDHLFYNYFAIDISKPYRYKWCIKRERRNEDEQSNETERAANREYP